MWTVVYEAVTEAFEDTTRRLLQRLLNGEAAHASHSYHDWRRSHSGTLITLNFYDCLLKGSKAVRSAMQRQ